MSRDMAINWMLFGLSAIYFLLAGEPNLAVVAIGTAIIAHLVMERIHRR